MSTPVSKPQLPPEISPSADPKVVYWARLVRASLRDLLAFVANSLTPVKQTEIDFGTASVWEKTFTITDARVTTSSYLVARLAYVAPTDKYLDELEFDTFDFQCVQAGAGSFTLYARALDGPVSGKFKVNYVVGVSF